MSSLDKSAEWDAKIAFVNDVKEASLAILTAKLSSIGPLAQVDPIAIHLALDEAVAHVTTYNEWRKKYLGTPPSLT